MKNIIISLLFLLLPNLHIVQASGLAHTTSVSHLNEYMNAYNQHNIDIANSGCQKACCKKKSINKSTSRLNECMNAYNQRSLDNIDIAISDCKEASSDGDLEAVIYLLRSYYFKGKYAIEDDESKKALFDKGKYLAEKYIEEYPDNAAIRYWYLVNLGSWAEVYGTIKAAREGVADIMKEQSENIIKLDPNYKDGGGYFMLGAVHLKSPYIPFLLSWPDKNKAVEYLRKAVDSGESTLVQKRYLAHALYKTGREEQAIELLKNVINSKPSQDEYIEDLEDIREAKLLLESF